MPADYVNKLFRMLQDIEVNKDLNNTFKKMICSNNNCIAGKLFFFKFFLITNFFTHLKNSIFTKI